MYNDYVNRLNEGSHKAKRFKSLVSLDYQLELVPGESKKVYTFNKP